MFHQLRLNETTRLQKQVYTTLRNYFILYSLSYLLKTQKYTLILFGFNASMSLELFSFSFCVRAMSDSVETVEFGWSTVLPVHLLKQKCWDFRIFNGKKKKRSDLAKK